MSDRPPQPTKTLIKRLRRHARAMKQNAAHGYTVKNISPPASAAMSNVMWQAAGRLEDLATACKYLHEAYLDPRQAQDPDILKFIERMEDIDGKGKDKDPGQTRRAQG
jgi:hypothetical protein